MDEPSLRLRQALDKFIKHVDDLIEEEDPAGNGFHREYRVSLTPRTIGDLTVCTCTPHITPEITVPALEFWQEGSTKVLLSLRGCQFYRNCGIFVGVPISQVCLRRAGLHELCPVLLFYLVQYTYRPWSYCCCRFRYVPWLNLSIVIICDTHVNWWDNY